MNCLFETFDNMDIQTVTFFSFTLAFFKCYKVLPVMHPHVHFFNEMLIEGEIRKQATNGVTMGFKK